VRSDDFCELVPRQINQRSDCLSAANPKEQKTVDYIKTLGFMNAAMLQTMYHASYQTQFPCNTTINRPINGNVSPATCTASFSFSNIARYYPFCLFT
jgi:hypothetical protein